MSTQKHDWLTPRAELTGLGILAAPEAIHVAKDLARRRAPGIKETAELTGLGVLAVPAMRDLAQEYHFKPRLPKLPKLPSFFHRKQASAGGALAAAAAALPTGLMIWDTAQGWDHEKHQAALKKALNATPETGGVSAVKHIASLDPKITVIDTPEKLKRMVQAEAAHILEAEEVTEAQRDLLIQFLSPILTGKNAMAYRGKKGEYVLTSPVMHPDVLNHEVGHLWDFREKGDHAYRLTGLDALKQIFWYPTYERTTMNAEREAWRRAADTPTKKEHEAAALGTYSTGFHRGRRAVTGALTLAGVLAAAPHLLQAAKHAALPLALSREKKEALNRVDRLLTRTDKQKWDTFAEEVSRKSLVRALEKDPRANETLKLHADSMNRMLTGKVVGHLGAYEIRKLRGKEELGCTCPDWRYKRSVAPPGDRECKHIQQWKAKKTPVEGTARITTFRDLEEEGRRARR